MGVRVVLAEDDVLLREGLAGLLTASGFEVAGSARDGAEAVALIREHDPDLAIFDIRMPPTQTTEGLDAARLVRAEMPHVGILVLSAHVDVHHATELLATGRGVGYLLKTRITDVTEFVDAVARIARGASVLEPTLVAELMSAKRRGDPLEPMSPREREVLALMAEGLTNAGIARRLWISEGTIEKHVRSILAKLDLPATEDDHRRVLAVLRYLDSR